MTRRAKGHVSDASPPANAAVIDPAPAIDVKERRREMRIGTHQNAAFGVSNVRYIVEARDVSVDGAQIYVRRGVVPAKGQDVTLQFMERQPIAATVVWTRDKSVGLKFLQRISELPDVLFFEDLGADYFRAILRFQRIRE